MQEIVIDTAAGLAGMIERAKLLAGPDYFTCERTHARVRKTECVMRQSEGVRLLGSLKKAVPPECADCPQGREIKESGQQEKKQGVKMSDEQRQICGDNLCKYWTAEGCTYTGPMPKGVCKRKYMQQYWADRSGKKKPGPSPPPQLKSATQAGLKKAADGEIIGLTMLLNFEEHKQLYENLKKAAADELRTIHNQALWYIRKGLRNDQ